MTHGRGARPLPNASRLRLLSLVVMLAVLLGRSSAARAADSPPRAAAFEWDPAKKELFVSLAFRDGVDEEIRSKLSRGLPTTIVFAGTLFRHGSPAPVSTTVQTCKITYSLWDEIYRVEITRPEGTKKGWTTTIEGVLRRCAEASRLLVATSKDVAFGTGVYVRGRVLVNPVKQETLDKIKLWVTRPARTGTAAPGDALFSTFTGLFMQRVPEAERILELVTFEILPVLAGATKNEI